MKINKTEEVEAAIERAKASNFGATHLKLELEAVTGISGHRCPSCLNRNTSDCETCADNGLTTMSFPDAKEFMRAGFTDDELRQFTYLSATQDASVDLEVLATIKLEPWDNVYLAVKLIERFNKLCNEELNGQNVENAGMHLSFLQNEAGYYPSENVNTGEYTYDTSYLNNFKESIERIIPALYLLGTDGSETRTFAFRKPQVSSRAKSSAVYYHSGALEFRVFDTCYDNPETVIDYVVVMCNSLRYWGSKHKITNIDMRKCRFGKERTRQELNDMFYTQKQLDALNKGLALLKPRYLTVAEIKKKRNFKVDKRWVKGKLEKIRKDAEKGYREYVNRSEWIQKVDQNIAYNDFVRYITGNGEYDLDKLEDVRKVNREVSKRMKCWKAEKAGSYRVIDRSEFMLNNAKNILNNTADCFVGTRDDVSELPF